MTGSLRREGSVNVAMRASVHHPVWPGPGVELVTAGQGDELLRMSVR
jgi:hypothetical protein